VPWREATSMTQKVKFIAEYLKEEVAFAALCREFEISRKTGYKWVARFHEDGLDGLKERSRAPHQHPNETPDDVVQVVLQVRREHPTWGARKIVAFVMRHRPDVAVPAASTLGAILKRHGLVAPRRRRIRVARSKSPLTDASAPNEVWCADFKGQFQLRGRGPYCHPLTISDLHSRYVLRCQGLGSTRRTHAQPVFLAAFREFGLPAVIRTDNGAPFASRSPGGLSALSAWWVRLGIHPERIQPSHPEQNGSHERMHRTLKAEATKPAERTLSAQQRRFVTWRREFNELRPHEALDMLTPSDCYSSSPRAYPRRLPRPRYDADELVTWVRGTGQTNLRGRAVYAGRSLRGDHVAFREVSDGVYVMRYYNYVVGKVDFRDGRHLRPA